MAVSVVIVNARVWTGDARRPWADAIAVEGERLRAVGSSAEVMKLAAGARVIDAKGAMVVAGSLADLVMIDRDLTRVAPSPQSGSNRAWKNRRYFGSYVIRSPVASPRRS